MKPEIRFTESDIPSIKGATVGDEVVLLIKGKVDSVSKSQMMIVGEDDDKEEKGKEVINYCVSVNKIENRKAKRI
jgi:hypothetical protein